MGYSLANTSLWKMKGVRAPAEAVQVPQGGSAAPPSAEEPSRVRLLSQAPHLATPVIITLSNNSAKMI